MADTYTPNLNLTKPEVGASRDTWGGKTNEDWDKVDAVFAGAGNGTSVGLNVGAGKTVAVAGTLNATGTVNLDTSVVINESGADKDFRVEGDTDANLLFTDASTDRVGVGTATPAVKLNVSAAAPQFRVTDPSTGSFGQFVSYDAGSGVRPTGIRVSGDGTGGTSDVMTLLSSGNVGIGMVPNRRLSVSGTGVVAGFNSSNNVYVAALSNADTIGGYLGASGTNLLFGTAGATEAMRIDASANIGIGGAPSTRLHVISADGVTNTRLAGASFAFRVQSVAGVGAVVDATDINENTYQPLLIGGSRTQFTIAGTEAMRIDASRNVSIGNSAPVTRLDVTGIATIRNNSAAWNSTPNTNYGLNFQAASTGVCHITSYSNGGSTAIAFATNSGAAAAVEAMRIDPSANVGIGTSIPGAKFQVIGSTTVAGYSNVAAAFGSGVTSELYVGSQNGNAPFVAAGGANPLLFQTNGAERVRIDASGNLMVGTTSAAGRFTSLGGSVSGVYATSSGNHALYADGLTTGFYGVYGASTNTSYGAVIGYHNSYNVFGILGYAGYGLFTNASISVNGTVYTSDARLKENVAPITNSLQKIAALNPVSFDWKAQSSRGPASDFGLIAQEVEQVIPECVFETATPRRTPEMTHAPTLEEELGSYKGVDYSRFIPFLIAAVKELSAENDTLKARVAALENK